MVRSVTVTGRRKKHDYTVWFGKGELGAWQAEVTVHGRPVATCVLDASDRACGTVAERLVDKVLNGEPLYREEGRLKLYGGEDTDG